MAYARVVSVLKNLIANSLFEVAVVRLRATKKAERSSLCLDLSQKGDRLFDLPPNSGDANHAKAKQQHGGWFRHGI
jgi:hypothetical protein